MLNLAQDVASSSSMSGAEVRSESLNLLAKRLRLKLELSLHAGNPSEILSAMPIGVMIPQIGGQLP